MNSDPCQAAGAEGQQTTPCAGLGSGPSGDSGSKPLTSHTA